PGRRGRPSARRRAGPAPLRPPFQREVDTVTCTHTHTHTLIHYSTHTNTHTSTHTHSLNYLYTKTQSERDPTDTSGYSFPSMSIFPAKEYPNNVTPSSPSKI